MIATALLLAVTSVSAANICDGGIKMVKDFEGFVSCPEPDPIGLPTVGYGHLCEKNDPNCKRCFTEAQASSFLVEDLQPYFNCVKDALGSTFNKMNPAQVAAMTSFTFNLGCGTFQKSDFLHRVINGEPPNTVAEEEFPKFVHAGGRVLSGLVSRRNAEVALFQGRGLYISQCGSSVTAKPDGGAPAPPKPHGKPKPNPKVTPPSNPGNSTTPGGSIRCTASVNNNDVVGLCMPSSSCGDSKLSVPWFCKGSDECCVDVGADEKATFTENKPYLGYSCSAPVNGTTLSGSCRYTSLCEHDGLTSVSGYCPGAENIQCCVGNKDIPPAVTTLPNPTAPSTDAPSPTDAPSKPKSSPAPEPAKGGIDPVTRKINQLAKTSSTAFENGANIGNIELVHLQSKPVKVSTAIAFEKMRIEAAKEGNMLKIISGFRTMQEQKNLYNLYLSGQGNLAARPGFSNHQNGRALDLNPEKFDNYNWLAKNGAKFSFCRTVPTERWHWEYRPTDKGACIPA
ncbi:hypothetical protein HDV04_005186 [Boothiomyces sp. JEL0838]|nr:hypothetical protein HDV04_005186 [Boothiomyces sp. JEL0838]